MTAKYGTNSLNAFFASLLSLPAITVAISEQEKELDEDAGSFQDVKDQNDVVDSEQRVVVCTELDDNHLSGEGQVVGVIVE